MRWIPEHQLHLTLAFLGDVAPEPHARLLETLSAIRVPPFVLRIEALGTFGRGRPSVLLAGTGTGHPHLFALHKRVHDALFAAGLDPELRAFRPHISIARIRGTSAESLRPLLRKHESTRFCTTEIRAFSLYSSQLHPEGAEHTLEASWNLQPRQP